MILKKGISIVSSIGVMMAMLPSTTVADDTNVIVTDHNTYIDLLTCVEYNNDGSVVSLEHMQTCEYYQLVYADWIQTHSTDDSEKTDEDSKTDEKSDSKTDEKTDDKTDEKTDSKTDEKADDQKSDEKTDDQKVTDTDEKADTTEKDSTKTEEKTEDAIKTEEEKIAEEAKIAESNYVEDTWYHPSTVTDNGYTGTVKKAIMEDNFVTSNWNKFKEDKNPFTLGECTYFAWSRFYQIYGYDSGARGNGKTNAAEIVQAHPDKFELSSTPAAGATFSIEKNSLYPQYGHVGFVEAFDGTYMYISEGNVTINGSTGNIWIHKVKWSDYKKQYPDITFAVPIQEKEVKIELKVKVPAGMSFKFKKD